MSTFLRDVGFPKAARIGLVFALLAALVPASWAQSPTGNIYGTVTDESGAVLSGATITLSGAGTQTSTSGTQGDFRFLNLAPGSYHLTVALSGFGTVARDVKVNTGINVNLNLGLKVATVEETVTVTAETPVVDSKKTGTSTTVSRDELEKTPQARDPWAVLRTIPGVMVDRVNVGGNESGQQANFTGKGSSNRDTQWSMDGVSITDMSAVGASPTYFDFDAFEEINVGTGGQDLRVQTGGIALNLVTKRGTNSFHGSARGFFNHRKLEWGNIAGTPLATDPRLKLSDQRCSDLGIGVPVAGQGCFSKWADHIDQIADYGADLGGPIVKDKVWFWLSYGRQDIRLERTNQTADKTVLKDTNAKLNWQASSSDMVTVTYFNGEKIKEGRPGYGSAFGLQEPDAALWNQANAYPGGPHGLLKFEDNHVFNPNFVLNVKYGYYGSGFSFTPRGGLDVDTTLDFTNGIVNGTSNGLVVNRPEHVATADANYFFTGAGGSHELKFGFSYKRYTVSSATTWPGSKVQGRLFAPSSGYALIFRDGANNYQSQYASGYVGDTFTKGRLTLNVGARYDHQTAENRASSVAANPIFPDLLPAVSFNGNAETVTWNDISPRVGLTYALDKNRKTLARASYARYAGQLSGVDALQNNPIGYNYLAYNWVDTNGDGLVQRNEVLTGSGITYYSAGLNLKNQNVSVSHIDPNFKANHDSEVIVGLDRELFANFAVSASYTYKKSTDLRYIPRLGLTSADYSCSGPVVARGYTSYGTCTPSSAKVLAGQNGTLLTNNPGMFNQYNGIEFVATKRLADKWMARGTFAYNDWTEHYDGGVAGNPGIQNPTRTQAQAAGGISGPQVDGGQVAPRSAGSGKGAIFYSAKWQGSLTALYQLPWAVELSANAFVRQGFPRPIRIQRAAGSDGTLSVLACPVGTASADCTIDNQRYPNLFNLDLRLAKTLPLAGDSKLVLSADAFNVLNKNTALNQNFTASSGAFNRLDEVLSPRIVRFGVRVTF
jgi:hypothetical protein